MKSIRFFLLSILLMDLSVAFAAVTWTGSSSAWTKGAGTQSDPYLIETPEQLAYLSEIVNAGVNLYDGIYFKQTADFDMDNRVWTPIGTSNTSNFKGNYNGNNKEIRNLRISLENDTYSVCGLFGYASGGIIENLNVLLNYNVISSAKVYVGGICAYCSGITIQNVTTSGKIYSENIETFQCNSSSLNGEVYIGGISGFMNNSSNISNCSNKCAIDSRAKYMKNARIGGVVGYAASSSISQCLNEDTIYVFHQELYGVGAAGTCGSRLYTAYVGGIAGQIKNQSSISNCGNKKNIKCTIGNYTYVTANNYIGGIVGSSESTQDVISECFNQGDIYSNIYGNSSSGNASGVHNVGGIVGAAFKMTINNSYNAGTTINRKDYYYDNKWKVIKISDCCGITASETSIISNCYSLTCGIAPSGTASNCYYLDNLSGDATSIGVSKTSELLKSASMPTILNGTSDNCWMSDVDNVNSGYPILKFQKTTATISIGASSNGQVQGGGTFSVGSSVTLTAIPNEGYTFSHWSDGNTNNPRTITATENAQYTAFFIPEGTENRLVFVAHQDGSTVGLVSLSSHQIIEYSTDETTWNNMTTATTVTLNNGEYIYLRGVLSSDNTSIDCTRFSISGSIAAVGNINVLWNYNDLNASLKQYCGCQMFKECSGLVQAPVLPAITLSIGCYNSMFQGCTALTSAPELPATVLAERCYTQMFDYCTALISVPAILPATTLKDYCYWRMFRGCSSLTSVPELPATVLTTYCYNQMFKQTSIVTAPELPADSLADYSYYQMFSQCPNLTYIKCLATKIGAIGCTENWVYSVASSGKFVKNSQMTSWTVGVNGIPSGWTQQDTIIPNKYIVTFVDWDGTILKIEQVEEGASATAPANPSRDWYTFIGWDKDFSSVTGNMIITAQYEEGVSYNYNLLFTNGTDNSEIVTRSISINMPIPPTITNFTFLKWQIVGGDLENTIEIRAIYTADSPTNTQSVIENPKNPAQKLIRNGNVYILTDDHTYTITGQEVR